MSGRRKQNHRLQFEQLENRRLLCGDGDLAAAPPANAANGGGVKIEVRQVSKDEFNIPAAPMMTNFTLQGPIGEYYDGESYPLADGPTFEQPTAPGNAPGSNESPNSSQPPRDMDRGFSVEDYDYDYSWLADLDEEPVDWSSLWKDAPPDKDLLGQFYLDDFQSFRTR